MTEMLVTIWSLFAMYLIVRYLNHRKFQKDMDRILREAIDEELASKVAYHTEPLVLRLFEACVKNYLLESKVVDKTVQFRWSHKEKIDAAN